MTVANAKPDQIVRGPLGTATVNAASSAWWDVSSVEAKISEAIAYAVSIGAKAVYVPDCFLPYNASLVTFNPAVLMTAEGQTSYSLTTPNVAAYGAATANSTASNAAAVQAAITYANASTVSNKIVWIPSAFAGNNGYAACVGSVTFNNNVQMVREGQTPGLYDVKAYGAVGDGVANDSVAIQAAVTACAASAGGGPGVVWLEASTYLIGTAIAIPNFVTLQGSGIGSLLRASGNNFIINLSPANRSRISQLAFDAASVQASGGAIDFTNAAQNIWLDGLYFGNNLFICLNIAPQGAGGLGVYILDKMRVYGSSNITTFLTIGDGTHFVTDILITNAIGTSPLVNPVQDWVKISTLSDTVFLSNCDFFQGVKGITVGSAGTTGPTQVRFVNVSVDTMSSSGAGLNLVSCRDFHAMNFNANTCGRGIDLQANVLDAHFVGGTIQGCVGSGVTCFTGATKFDFDGMLVTDNNTGNGGSGQGFDIGASVSDWSVRRCRIGNFLLGTGHQKVGVNIPTTATRCYVTDNSFNGNETTQITDTNGVAYRRGNSYSTGALQGTATLTAANPAVTVSTTQVRTGDKINLMRKTAGGTLGHLSIGAITDNTSFTIVASGNLETSTVDWEIVH